MTARDDHAARVLAGVPEHESWRLMFDEIDYLRRLLCGPAYAGKTSNDRSARRRAKDLAQLFDDAANQIQSCVNHLNTERNTVNAWPASTMGDGGSRSTGSTSRPLAAVLAVASIEANLRQVDDDLDALESVAKSVLRICRRTLGVRAPVEMPRCSANPDFEGYSIPLADGGWRDVECDGTARSSATYSLCDRCRKRFERFRDRTEPLVEFDSESWVGDDGVAHSRPVRGAA